MTNLPLELYSVSQIRELETMLATQYRLSAAELMSRAGMAGLKAIGQQWPWVKHILVICGSGNNGGDGLVLAKAALAEKYQIHVIQLGDPATMSEAARAAREALLATGTEIHQFNGKLPHADVIVDALFGTGLNREVSGDYAAVINKINEQSQQVPVLSLDIPSGIQADTGLALGLAVQASMTLSFLGLNTGLFSAEAPNYTGKIGFDGLDAPARAYQAFMPTARRVTLDNDAAAHLAPRPRTAHKGLYGHLLVIGGDQGMSGAARMAAEAACRVGSGLVSVATHPAHSPYLNLARPELMCHGVQSADDLDALLASASVITLGPGLGQKKWGAELFQKALKTQLPMVVDADALNLLSNQPQRRDNWILTPHPGEAARLLGSTAKQIQSDRFAAVEALQQRYGGVVVLKGAGTLICCDKAPVRLSTSGNPGMATGGMGDVLAGVIGGLLAQHVPLMDAACAGVVLHGMAADKTAARDGERGTLAMDLMPHLRKLANLDDE